MSLIGSISVGFVQNMMYDFQNTVLNSFVALSSTNATKTDLQGTVILSLNSDMESKSNFLLARLFSLSKQEIV